MKHRRHPSKLLSNFLNKKLYLVFSDISLPRLGKNMSIALQNMTKSKKKQKSKQYSKHSKQFSFRLEKYNNS